MMNDMFRNREVVRANNGAIGFLAGQFCIPNMGLFSSNSVQQQHRQLKEAKGETRFCDLYLMLSEMSSFQNLNINSRFFI